MCNSFNLIVELMTLKSGLNKDIFDVFPVDSVMLFLPAVS